MRLKNRIHRMEKEILQKKEIRGVRRIGLGRISV